MRILTSSKVYRAFPELDRFEDERCERFVKAAKSSLWWNWGSKAGLFVLLIGVGAATFFGYAMALERLDRNPRAIQSDALHVLAISGLLGVTLAIPFLVMLLARDLNLRKRLHHILRSRGSCMSCHYSLVGLAVDERCVVICPECGGATQVDESLGELVLDDAGKARFKPSEDALPLAKQWPSPEARRTIKKWFKRVVVGVPLLLVVGWGTFELVLLWQASVAKRERPGPSGILAFVEKAQPTDAPPGSPDAWEVFNDLSVRIAELESRLNRSAPATASGKRVQLDASAIYWTPRADDDETKEAHALEVRLAREFLKAAKDDGLFDLMHDMASRKRAVRAIAFSSAQPSIEALLPELGIARKFARINAARFVVAREQGDAAEMGRAMEANLALARMCSLQATMLDGLVGVAIEALAMSHARDALMGSPSSAMVDAIGHALASQAPRESIAFTLRGEHLCLLDTVCWVFGDSSNVRLGRLTPKLKRLGIQGDVRTPLGFYWENRDQLAMLFNHFERVAPQEPYARAPSAQAYGVPNLLVLGALTPAINRSMEMEHHANLMRRGVRAMVALEKHRLERGVYPEALAALVPAYLDTLPIDPWSGTVLGYKRVDPATDPHQRGYLLYSVGADLQDDSGVPCAADCYNAGRAAGKTDFIINRPEK